MGRRTCRLNLTVLNESKAMKIIADEASNTIPHTRMWTVQADHIDRPFLVSVTVPQGEAPEGGWNGVVATDGNMSVGSVVQVVGYPAMEGHMPAAVVVTIGYPLDWPLPHALARNQDLTYLPWPEWDQPYGEILGSTPPPSGEADLFLGFINDELKPAIEQRFSVNPDQWTLMGHSLGGLFATHALLSNPGRFRRYLAVGSSYWWMGGHILGRAEAFAALADSVDARIYISAGGLETAEAFKRQWAPLMEQEVWQRYLGVMGGYVDIVGDSARMADILSGRTGLRAAYETIPEETHGTAVLPAYVRGMRWLHSADG